ncbi:MAG: ATP-binding cassette domain-containing protein [Myxococcales bacterium]|nr:ATP-binding cassette domain-containing protein [Myxococcales bacterium]
MYERGWPAFPARGACYIGTVIAVKELSRRFGSRIVLDRVSFCAQPGEVLGLLGPNGAGKTTTLRILAGFLAPNAGSVTIDGIELAQGSPAVRARIGYLPESVPLYPEMRVAEYLDYRAALKGVPRRQRRERVASAAAEVGVEGELHQVIGRLSRGYRQRVGLADALTHHPSVLLLDEPTEGLDPNQRRALLETVRGLGRERTVVLSTHVLPEVEAVCGRVAILARGRVVATGTPAELGGGGRVRIEAEGPADALTAALRAVPGVSDVEVLLPEGAGDRATRFLVAAPGAEVRDAAARAVIAAGGVLLALGRVGSRLDEVFAALTQEPPA